MPTVTHIIDNNLPVYATGDQTITGIKIFQEKIAAPTINGVSFPANLHRVDMENGYLGRRLLFPNENEQSLNWLNRELSGQWRTNGRIIYASGNIPYSVSGDPLLNVYSYIPCFGDNVLLASGRNTIHQVESYCTGSINLYLPSGESTKKGDQLSLSVDGVFGTSVEFNLYRAKKVGLNKSIEKFETISGQGYFNFVNLGPEGLNWSDSFFVSQMESYVNNQVPQIDLSSTVQITGDQIISGSKTFQSTGEYLFTGTTVNFVDSSVDFTNFPTVNNTGVVVSSGIREIVTISQSGYDDLGPSGYGSSTMYIII